MNTTDANIKQKVRDSFFGMQVVVWHLINNTAKLVHRQREQDVLIKGLRTQPHVCQQVLNNTAPSMSLGHNVQHNWPTSRKTDFQAAFLSCPNDLLAMFPSGDQWPAEEFKGLPGMNASL